ncbi:ABC transporter substrate-binding protein [Celeribacter marinus]|uniref:Sugar-binding protein n=1 Tax=Celeribacter marinus TaxID=1397108 RepID=A0A0N7HJ50_9RHOB|nr:ABC transporter substrate-binding protein [Celeribacter marinus]ALI57037.1 sugar-binding protein precursor [Celeribacter marinus]SFK71859.1 oligogalacturonide transport system substrate-binding protein [Celeribacter marinus]
MTHFKTLIATVLATTTLGSTAYAEELRMSWWGGDSRHEATQAALQVCGESLGHTIKPEFTGWSGHFEKVATQLAGGTEADIMQINWPWLPIFSKNGDGFADLRNFSDTIDLSQWSDEELEASTRNGALNGLPASVSGRIFFFNKTTFDKAGLAIPTTFEDLMAAGPIFAEKLGDNYYPLEGIGLDASLLIQMVVTQQTGKSFINPETNEVQWSKEDLQAGLNMYQAMVENHVIKAWPDMAAAGNVALHENADWTSGKIGGSYQWDTTFFKISDPLSEGQELVPAGLLRVEGAQNDGVYRKPSMVFSISANSPNQQAAAEVLNCMLTQPSGIDAMGSARGVPSSDVAATQLLENGGIQQIQVDAQNMVMGADAPAISPYNEDPDVRAGIEDTLELFAYGELDSADASEEILMLVNEALEDK